MKDFVKKIDKQKLTVIVAVLGLFLLTAGVTYAFFTYIGSGSTENTISSDSITFLYEEKDKQGNGINIIDATPVSDEVGKAGPAFNFEITSKTANKISIPYEIAVRKKAGSDNLDDVVKLYLTKVDGSGNEEEVALGTFSSFTTKTYYGNQQKLLTEQKVPQSSSNYIQKYRLRMWIDEDADFSTGNYNDKTFSVTVNVYSEGKVVTPEDMANMNNAGVLQVLLDGNEIFPTETNGTHYEETLPAGTKNAELVIKPANKYSKVEIGKTDSTYTNLIAMNPKTGIVPIASTPSMTTNAHIKLNDGDNYFKGVITAEDGVTTQTLTFKLTVPAGQAAGNTLAQMIIADNTIIPEPKTAHQVLTEMGGVGEVEDEWDETTTYTLPNGKIYEVGSDIYAYDNLTDDDYVVIPYEEGFYSTTATDSGNPTYYFRGNMTNNKVRYAGMDWLVVRINDDGTVRLVLSDILPEATHPFNNLSDMPDSNGGATVDLVGSMYYSSGLSRDNAYTLAKDYLNSWYQTNIGSNDNYSKWIADKSGNYFCEAFKIYSSDSSYDFLSDASIRMNQYTDPTYACTQDAFGHRYVPGVDVGLLTLDEIMHAGLGKTAVFNSLTYLQREGDDKTLFTLSPSGLDPYGVGQVYIYYTDNTSVYTGNASVGYHAQYLRPVINLKAATTATRDGNGGYIVD